MRFRSFAGNKQPLCTTAANPCGKQRTGIKNNNRIGKAKEDVIATQSDKLIADVAGRPKLDASATAFYFGEPLNTMLPEYGFAPMVSVTQPIYTGGG
jgi:hypothetical protein